MGSRSRPFPIAFFYTPQSFPTSDFIDAVANHCVELGLPPPDKSTILQRGNSSVVDFVVMCNEDSPHLRALLSGHPQFAARLGYTGIVKVFPGESSRRVSPSLSRFSTMKRPADPPNSGPPQKRMRPSLPAPAPPPRPPPTEAEKKKLISKALAKEGGMIAKPVQAMSTVPKGLQFSKHGKEKVLDTSRNSAGPSGTCDRMATVMPSGSVFETSRNAPNDKGKAVTSAAGAPPIGRFKTIRAATETTDTRANSKKFTDNTAQLARITLPLDGSPKDLVIPTGLKSSRTTSSTTVKQSTKVSSPTTTNSRPAASAAQASSTSSTPTTSKPRVPIHKHVKRVLPGNESRPSTTPSHTKDSVSSDTSTEDERPVARSKAKSGVSARPASRRKSQTALNRTPLHPPQALLPRVSHESCAVPHCTALPERRLKVSPSVDPRSCNSAFPPVVAPSTSIPKDSNLEARRILRGGVTRPLASPLQSGACFHSATSTSLRGKENTPSNYDVTRSTAGQTKRNADDTGAETVSNVATPTTEATVTGQVIATRGIGAQEVSGTPTQTTESTSTQDTISKPTLSNSAKPSSVAPPAKSTSVAQEISEPPRSANPSRSSSALSDLRSVHSAQSLPRAEEIQRSVPEQRRAGTSRSPVPGTDASVSRPSPIPTPDRDLSVASAPRTMSTVIPTISTPKPIVATPAASLQSPMLALAPEQKKRPRSDSDSDFPRSLKKRKVEKDSAGAHISVSPAAKSDCNVTGVVETNGAIQRLLEMLSQAETQIAHVCAEREQRAKEARAEKAQRVAFAALVARGLGKVEERILRTGDLDLAKKVGKIVEILQRDNEDQTAVIATTKKLQPEHAQDLERSIERSEEQLARYRLERLDLEQQLASERTKNGSLEKQVEEQRVVSIAREEELQNLILKANVWQSDLEKISSDLASRSAQTQALEDAFEAKSAALLKLDQLETRYHAERLELEKQVAEGRAANESLMKDAREQHIINLAKERDLRNLLADSNARQSDLQTQLATACLTYKSLVEEKRAHSAAQELDYRRLLMHSRAALQRESKAKSVMLVDLEDRIQTSKADLSSHQERYEAARSELDQARDGYTALQSELDTERSKRVSAEQELEEVRRECKHPFVVPLLLDLFLSIQDKVVSDTKSE